LAPIASAFATEKLFSSPGFLDCLPFGRRSRTLS